MRTGIAESRSNRRGIDTKPLSAAHWLRSSPADQQSQGPLPRKLPHGSHDELLRGGIEVAAREWGRIHRVEQLSELGDVDFDSAYVRRKRVIARELGSRNELRPSLRHGWPASGAGAPSLLERSSAMP